MIIISIFIPYWYSNRLPYKLTTLKYIAFAIDPRWALAIDPFLGLLLLGPAAAPLIRPNAAKSYQVQDRRAKTNPTRAKIVTEIAIAPDGINSKCNFIDI